jgi:hypothetical protein
VKLPFTVEQFFAVFARYNLVVWPAQVVLVALAVLVVALLVWRPRPASRVVSATLALFWAWMAVAYHLAFFAAINPAARVFGVVFLVQAVLFVLFGVTSARLRFDRVSTGRTTAGSLLIAYALAGYPLLGWLAGHRYPAVPTFGAPCPTTILTLGVLLFVRRPFPRLVAVIPLMWAAVGTSAALTLGVPEDLGLTAAGVVVLSACMLPRVGASRAA